jgi:GNAT superfamily N-acetyltransferase
VTLRLATAAEARVRDVGCAQVWGGGLSVEQFVEREAVLRAHRWPRQVMRSWQWVDGPRVLASCETFELGSHVGASSGHTHLIASVFTEPPLRGRGHAAAMLREVARWSREGGAQAMVLFSEIGPRLYGSLGFRAVPSFDLVLPARAGALVGSSPELTTVRPAPLERTLTVTRDEGQLDWQLERERFYGRVLGRALPRRAGAAVPGGAIGWTAYFKTGELQVLWLDGEGPVRRALLEAAQAEAAHLGLTLVRVWLEGDGAWARAWPGASVVARDDEVPMFLPFAQGLERWAPIERAVWG